MDRWEPYQIMAAYEGWRLANTASGEAKAPSDEEFEAAVSRTMH